MSAVLQCLTKIVKRVFSRVYVYVQSTCIANGHKARTATCCVKSLLGEPD